VAAPQSNISWQAVRGLWVHRLHAEYSRTHGVPTYTSLASSPSGLFGGNPNLSRNRADTYEWGWMAARGTLEGRVTYFYREDTGLVDWTYAANSPNARQANPLDDTVHGIEAKLRYEWENGAFELASAWLDKDPDYGNASVDASYYVLNYSKWRVQARWEQTLTDGLSFDLNADWQDRAENPLRTTGDEGFFLDVGLRYEGFADDRLVVRIEGRNLTDEDLQEFPGTPSPGREGRVILEVRW